MTWEFFRDFAKLYDYISERRSVYFEGQNIWTTIFWIEMLNSLENMEPSAKTWAKPE